MYGCGAIVIAQAPTSASTSGGSRTELASRTRTPADGQPHVDAPSIGSVAHAHDVALALESIDRQRHRPGRDAHMAREAVQRDRVDLVEVIEDARLVAAEQMAALRSRTWRV